MKFTNGNWLVKDGIKIYGATEVVDFEMAEYALTLYAMPFHVKNKGDTLGGPMLTIVLTAPHEDVIKINAYHFKRNQKGPEFILNEEKRSIIVEEENEFINFKSGNLVAKIKKHGDFSIRFFYKNIYLTGSDLKSLAYIVTEDGKTFMREQLNLGVGEYVYGLGERFTSFVKNGQTVEIWNADGGTNSEQAYKNIPFYVTNKGYGVFVNTPGLISYEIASERVSKVQFSVESENLEYMVIGGSGLKEVLKNYTDITGKPSLPPAWSFGLWLTTSFTTSYDEKTVNQFIDGMAKRDIPLSVFHFDCFWMKAFQWVDLEWDKNQFPDPSGMIKRLKGNGLKISVWINPYIAQKSKLFDEAVKNGYLLKKSNGDVWQWDLWQPGMGIVDFTNPRATVGSQKFPVHWGGDSSATYESMAESLRGGLSLGLCGFGFWSHDIAGFESNATPDLYKRWSAFGLLSSHSRLHGNSTYKVPWLYDEESVDVLRFFTKFKNRLMPYIYSKAVETSQNGIPMIRPTFVEFDDPTCLYLDRQYMFGDALLVAPIFSEDGIVTYYLPKGKWMNFITKEVVEGESWRTEKHGYMSLPLMLRENTVIAMGNTDSRPDYDYSDNVTFHIFGIKDGANVSSKVYDLHGNVEVEIRVKRDGEFVDVNVENLQNKDKKWNLMVYDKVKSVDGGDKSEEIGTRIIPKNKHVMLNLF